MEDDLDQLFDNKIKPKNRMALGEIKDDNMNKLFPPKRDLYREIKHKIEINNKYSPARLFKINKKTTTENC